jgi:putative aldouronate transport system substrate-binding protein
MRLIIKIYFSGGPPMKTRRLLALLLVLVMSISMILTSCIRPPEPPVPGPGPDPTPDGPGTVVDPNEENYAAAIALAQSWGTVDYLYYKQNAYDRLMNFYKNPTSNSIKDYTLSYAPDTTLRMATGYNNAQTGLFFDAKIAGDGITLADGKTYHTGDLKPTWVAVSDRLDINFENKWRGEGSAEKEFNYWKDQLDQVDMVSGTATQLSEAGVAGKLVNLALYLDAMPNFKAYLEANPIVRLSITGNVDDGAIYFSPYFDGVDDIERMPLMRTDWVEKLLNGEGAFTADASNNLAAAAYTPYMPTSGKITVDAASKDATKVIKLTKDYDAAGNIVQVMNDALAAGTVNGVQAVNMLREYIDKAYNGYYGTNRADLFIG